MRRLAAAFLIGAAGALVELGGASAQGTSERLAPCLACHGETGASTSENVPSLGGQPSFYVLIQLFMFRQDMRPIAPMNELTRAFTDADLQEFADAIAKLPPPRPLETDADPQRSARGRALAARHQCTACHGNALEGNNNVPRLAAQREDYLAKALRDYKAQARREYRPAMDEVVRPLSDSDIQDLAHAAAYWR